MKAHHVIPAQYCFALDFKNYNEHMIHYANISVLYYQFTTSSLDETVVVADGCADFQFCCDESDHSAMLWGSVITPTQIHYTPDRIYCGIRLSTSLSRRIAYLPYSETINRGISFSDIPQFDSHLISQLKRADNFLSRIKVLESWLIKSGTLKDFETDLVDYCIDKIIESHGSIRIADIADDIGISDRLLRKKFNQSVGVSPKQYSRIVRFQGFIGDFLYANKHQQNVYESTRDFSYYDDSHLIKDFKYFTQMTPSWFLEKMLGVQITRNDETANP